MRVLLLNQNEIVAPGPPGRSGDFWNFFWRADKLGRRGERDEGPDDGAPPAAAFARRGFRCGGSALGNGRLLDIEHGAKRADDGAELRGGIEHRLHARVHEQVVQRAPGIGGGAQPGVQPARTV